MAKTVRSEPNFFLDHPGWTGTAFAVLVAATFLGLLLSNLPKEGHSEGAAAESASHAPAASAAPSAATKH
jgi:hypothetical protein